MNDTGNITSVPFPLTYPNNGPASISIAGGPHVAFLDTINVFANPSSLGVGFEDQLPLSCPGCGSDILDDISGAFSAYQLNTAIGPITGTAVFNAGLAFATADGDLILDSVGDPTFTATTSGGAGACFVGDPVRRSRWVRRDPATPRIAMRRRFTHRVIPPGVIAGEGSRDRSLPADCAA